VRRSYSVHTLLRCFVLGVVSLMMAAIASTALSTKLTSHQTSIPESAARHWVITPSPRFESDKMLFAYLHENLPQAQGERMRIWRSEDDGLSWHEIVDYQDPQSVGGGIILGLPAPSHVAPITYLHFSHGQVTPIYEMWRSEDGGDTWEERTSPSWRGACSGPIVAGDSDILFSPCGHFWLYHSIGIDRSSDTGRTWERVWADTGIYQVVASPAFTVDGTLFASVQLGYEPPPVPTLIASFDGGDTWQASDEGLCDMAVDSIALSPDFTHDRTLFAIQSGIVFKSQDAGQAWMQVFPEPGGQCETPSYVYTYGFVVSPNYAYDHTVFWLKDRTLFVSYDEGLNWQRLTSNTNAFAMAVRRSAAATATPATAAAKIDPLASYEPSNQHLADIHRVFLPLVMQRGSHPLPLTIFLSAPTPYRSDDSGVTWTPVRLPPAAEVYLPLVLASP
jgi:photosystem II stability/assembly factor-like uncharacterized protein